MVEKTNEKIKAFTHYPSNSSKVTFVATVLKVNDPKTVNLKSGKQAEIQVITLVNPEMPDMETEFTLWESNVGTLKAGDEIVVKNAWCKTYNGKPQWNLHKDGRIEKRTVG